MNHPHWLNELCCIICRLFPLPLYKTIFITSVQKITEFLVHLAIQYLTDMLLIYIIYYIERDLLYIYVGEINMYNKSPCILKHLERFP